MPGHSPRVISLKKLWHFLTECLFKVQTYGSMGTTAKRERNCHLLMGPCSVSTKNTQKHNCPPWEHFSEWLAGINIFLCFTFFFCTITVKMSCACICFMMLFTNKILNNKNNIAPYQGPITAWPATISFSLTTVGIRLQEEIF